MNDEQSALSTELEKNLSSESQWNEIVTWVGDLPPLPYIAAQALALIENPDTTARKLTELLGEDTALAARVLKIANSAMFSRQREITTINQAIMIIGFDTLKGIIIAATLRQLNRKLGKIEQMLWENSVCTAVAARNISIRLRKPFAEEAFLLGLLHDLGKLVMMRQIPEDYTKVIAQTSHGKLFVDVEQELFGFSHQLIGALVAKKWNFSIETCQVILNHHDPIKESPRSILDEKTAIIKTADLIAHTLGYGHQEGYVDHKSEAVACCISIGFDGDSAIKLISEINQLFQESSGGLI